MKLAPTLSCLVFKNRPLMRIRVAHLIMAENRNASTTTPVVEVPITMFTTRAAAEKRGKTRQCSETGFPVGSIWLQWTGASIRLG